jgi:hypothetical protein
MKKLLLILATGILITFGAATAEAKVAAVYASGYGGVQSGTNSETGLGFNLGARILIFDGYVDYTGFGQGTSVSRGILGLRGGFGTSDLRLVLRAGAGAIREQGGALTGPLGAPDRTGAVARAGVAIEGAVAPVLYVGFGVDGESFVLPDNGIPGSPTRGSDIFASLRLTFELGI